MLCFVCQKQIPQSYHGQPPGGCVLSQRMMFKNFLSFCIYSNISAFEVDVLVALAFLEFLVENNKYIKKLYLSYQSYVCGL